MKGLRHSLPGPSRKLSANVWHKLPMKSQSPFLLFRKLGDQIGFMLLSNELRLFLVEVRPLAYSTDTGGIIIVDPVGFTHPPRFYEYLVRVSSALTSIDCSKCLCLGNSRSYFVSKEFFGRKYFFRKIPNTLYTG